MSSLSIVRAYPRLPMTSFIPNSSFISWTQVMNIFILVYIFMVKHCSIKGGEVIIWYNFQDRLMLDYTRYSEVGGGRGGGL